MFDKIVIHYRVYCNLIFTRICEFRALVNLAQARGFFGNRAKLTDRSYLAIISVPKTKRRELQYSTRCLLRRQRKGA